MTAITNNAKCGFCPLNLLPLPNTHTHTHGAHHDLKGKKTKFTTAIIITKRTDEQQMTQWEDQDSQLVEKTVTV